VVAVGDSLPSVISLPGGERDPHWWHSIGNMVLATDVVRAELARERPASAGVFAENARTYQRRLEGLRAWVAAEIGKLPPGRRQLVTSHDAFGYFARDYGFAIHAINGLSTDSEADARHLAALIDLIRRERIPAVFAEDSANPRVVENLLREAGVRLGGTLYADGLGPAGSGAETYDEMYRHNVRTIVEALSGP
jgi:zinc/manganese transport system substrate-binding protein